MKNPDRLPFPDFSQVVKSLGVPAARKHFIKLGMGRIEFNDRLRSLTDAKQEK